MYISAHMITLNGMPFIEPAIKGILPHVDEFIIVEGVTERFSQSTAVDTSGISTDGTHEFLEYISSQNPKIKLKSGGLYKNKNVLRNECLKMVKQTPHWIWMVDDDEVYDGAAKDAILKGMKENEGVPCLTYLHAPIKRFDQWTPPNKYKYMERLVWYLPGSTYGNQEGGQSIKYPDGTKPWANYKVLPEPARCHHYHIMSDEEYIRKNQFYVSRGDLGAVEPDKVYETAVKMTNDIKAKWKPWDIEDHPGSIKLLDIYQDYKENKNA